MEKYISESMFCEFDFAEFQEEEKGTQWIEEKEEDYKDLLNFQNI